MPQNRRGGFHDFLFGDHRLAFKHGYRFGGPGQVLGRPRACAPGDVFLDERVSIF
jgi:hypothetical protein